jgi:diguanylate cyclase (GGDEF)-like protein
MMDNAGIANMLFEYLRDVIYSPQKAKLDVEKLPEEFRQLGLGLQFFAASVNEMREFSTALSRGDLDAHFPSKGNELTAPLKALHASLKHMTWQSHQVAKGDYQQHLEFLGSFADAFNTMILQLDQRQKALIDELESGKKKTRALEQSNNLFVALTEHTPQWIIVADDNSDDWLYTNGVVKRALQRNPSLRGYLRQRFMECGHSRKGDEPLMENELELELGGQQRFFSFAAYPLQWHDKNAHVYLLGDISAEKQQFQALQTQAYRDALTGLYNRFYSMQRLNEWLDEKREFCICFVDLDNLKYVNDNLGHSEGDNYIIAAARALERLAGDAVVSRLGGDEFMLLVPARKKKPLEERLRALCDEMIRWNNSPGAPYMRSMSYGVVQVDTDNELPASDLLGLADERMYMFKRLQKSGRKNGIPGPTV